MTKALKWVGLALPLLLLSAFAGGLWSATNQLLFPAWKGATHDLAFCPPALAESFGPGCGNLRVTHALKFTEVRLPSAQGEALPGWLIGSNENGFGAPRGAVLLVHGGGSDRREMTRIAPFFLARQLDVLAFDVGCAGEAPCPVPGLTYGERESRDVLAAYLFLQPKYEKVYAMGGSVGAASILIALPAMPRLAAAVLENPMQSFDRLIRENPASQGMPGWFLDVFLGLTKVRGHFTGLVTADHAVRLAHGAPLLFVHSLRDSVVSHAQSQALADAYQGPKTTWFPDAGDHAAIWNADRAAYEATLTAFLDGLDPR